MSTALHKAALTALFAFAVLHPITLRAQDLEPTRYELEFVSSKQTIHALPVDGQGVILFYDSPADDSLKQPLWTFIHADTNLRETANATFRLGRGSTMVAKAISGTQAAIVFQSKPKESAPELHIISLGGDKRFAETRVPLGDGFSATDAALADSMLLVATKGNDTNKALIVDLQNGKATETGFGLTGNNVVFQMDAVADRFVAALKVFEKKRFVRTAFVTLDMRGNIVRTDSIANSSLGSLGRFCFGTDSIGNLIVLATLETETGKKKNAAAIGFETEREARGVCFAKFADSTTIRNFRFGSPKRTQVSKRTDNIVELTPSNSKQPSPTCLLLPPQLTTSDDKLILTCEAYTYEYRPETRISYDFYGRSIPTTYYVFEGYNFYNTFVIAFDGDGNACWSNNFNFENPIRQSLESNVSCTAIDSTLIFASALKNEIRYRMFRNNGSVLLSDGSTKAELFFANDEIANETSCRIDKWFGNTCIMYGVQTIDNGRLTGKNRRNVFFLQRIDFK